MKLYTYDPAPNPRRLALFLKHKGLDIESQQVDLMTGEQLGEAYRAINPHCTVPALVLDDGTVLTEVIGIVTYLEALHPEKPLLGTTPLEKALVSSWDHHLFVGLMSAVASILRNASKGFQNRALPGPPISTCWSGGNSSAGSSSRSPRSAPACGPTRRGSGPSSRGSHRGLRAPGNLRSTRRAGQRGMGRPPASDRRSRSPARRTPCRWGRAARSGRPAAASSGPGPS